MAAAPEMDALRAENDELRLRLAEAEEALEAIRTGAVDSLIIDGPSGPRIFALEGATHSYRVLVESMNEGAVTLSEDGTVLYCNARFAEMLGLRLQRVMGSALRDYLPAPSRAAFDHLVDRALEAGARAELTLRAPDGAELPVYLSLSSIVDEGRRIFCVVATDLREQKRSEALAAAEQRARASEHHLREVDRRKDEFLAVLSHELRNPLAPIRNAAYILRRVDPGSEQARRAQGVIERQTEHLTRLVDDLLDVTRVARGKIELRLDRVDLREPVRRTAEDLRALVEDRGVTLQVSVPEAHVLADVDSIRIAQAIGNLLNNSAKFTRRGDTITLSLERREAAAVVRVKDTGSGIDPALLPRLFEPFVQGDRTLARSAGGLGLGLALVKGIAELHGGTVSARSEGIDRGAEFALTIPLAAVDLAGEHRRPAAGARRSSGRRVLVVDDNIDAAHSLADALALAGHEVEIALDGPTALERARQNRPDVVLCDIGLPGMSGYEVARTLRAAGPDVPQLFAVSGYAQPEDVAKALASGFDGHLSKPYDLQQIERLLT